MLANNSLDILMVGKLLGEHDLVKGGVTGAITKEMLVGLVFQVKLEQFLIFHEVVQESWKVDADVDTEWAAWGVEEDRKKGR